jgi:hypothetical protein
LAGELLDRRLPEVRAQAKASEFSETVISSTELSISPIRQHDRVLST